MSQKRSVVSYLKWPLIVTFIGLVLSAWLGWETEKTLSAVFSFLLVGIVLAALEIALSFDNAIVNANKLVEMTPIWRQRFLTWGILIAGFWDAYSFSSSNCCNVRLDKSFCCGPLSSFGSRRVFSHYSSIT